MNDRTNVTNRSRSRFVSPVDLTIIPEVLFVNEMEMEGGERKMGKRGNRDEEGRKMGRGETKRKGE